MPVYSGRPDVPLLHGDLNIAYICDLCEAGSIKALKPQVGMGCDWYYQVHMHLRFCEQARDVTCSFRYLCAQEVF